MEISLNCPHCGEELIVEEANANKVKICPYCGKPLKKSNHRAGEIATQESAKKLNEAVEQDHGGVKEEREPKPKNEKNKLMRIVAISVAALFACSLLFFNLAPLFSKNEPMDGGWVVSPVVYYESGFHGECTAYDSVTIVGYTKSESNALKIPEKIQGYSVTGISDGVFKDDDELTSVIIPNSVTSIGEGAFQGCSNLTNLAIGRNVSIAKGAFDGCDNLTNVYYDGMRSEWQKVAGSNEVLMNATVHFYDQDATTGSASGMLWRVNQENDITITGRDEYVDVGDDLTIPEMINGRFVTEIEMGAFGGNASTTNIILPDTLKKLGFGAFGGAGFSEDARYLGTKTNPYFALVAINSALTTFNIRAETKIVDCGAFLSENLTEITVDENNDTYQSIDGNLYSKDGAVFVRYATGKEDVEFSVPDGVKEIGDFSFAGTNGDNLCAVTLSDSVTSIGYGAFAVSSLTSVIIPDSVTSIGTLAFGGCDSLTTIVISDSVTLIGESAFAADGLTICCEAESQPSGWNTNWNSYDCPVVWGYVAEE